MTLLVVRDLRKSFAGKPVLRLSQLTLATGEIALLRGDNGAGKTTLLRILAGLTKPDHCGHFFFAGGDKAMPPAAAYLHQSPRLFATTVRANVEYGARRCRLPLVRADEAMEWAGIADLAAAPVSHLSGGARRRVALARIRALRPKLYLLDEPTAHLDADGNARVRALLESLQTEKATAIIATHDNLPATACWRLHDGIASETR